MAATRPPARSPPLEFEDRGPDGTVARVRRIRGADLPGLGVGYCFRVDAAITGRLPYSADVSWGDVSADPAPLTSDEAAANRPELLIS